MNIFEEVSRCKARRLTALGAKRKGRRAAQAERGSLGKPLAGAMLGSLCGATIHQRIGKLLLGVDAAALGLFAVAGSTRALAAGMTFLPTLVLGVVTAVGGGSLRDVFSGRTPKVFERGEPYALVAALVAVLFLASDRWTGNRTLATSIGIPSGFLVRALALKFRWKTREARVE